MSRRLLNIEVDGFDGPLTIQALSESQLERLRQRPDVGNGQDAGDFAIYVLHRGLVLPKWDTPAAEPIRSNPDLLSRVVEAILDLSLTT